ncbi:MAG: fumarate reductase subunit C [Actinomycetota bacterium]
MSRENGRKYPVYVPRQSRTWWLRTGAYRRFAAREITSMFAAIFSGLLLAFLFALSRGPQAYRDFLGLLDSRVMVALSALILVALLYHTATWFRLSTYILVVRLGRTTVPKRVVLAGLIGAWLVASAAVAYFHIWF